MTLVGLNKEKTREGRVWEKGGEMQPRGGRQGGTIDEDKMD